MTVWSVEGIESRVDGFRLGPIELTLAPGRPLIVLGRSGAGKTTLLRTLAGFVPVDAGRIVRGHTDLTARPPEMRGLGYVPQGLGLFPHRTVERNVSYPLEMRSRTDARARARELLDRFHLLPLARRYPARLSGGELERVALARALAGEPELILWDEPWQALDVEARFELGRVVEELRATEVPVVVVTHDPALAFAAGDSFLVLRRGRPTFLGEPGALLERPVDAFTARFVGYENLYGRESLEAAGAGELAAWLAKRAGPGGVAFARPVVLSDRALSGSWAGVLRRCRPTPDGLDLTLSVGSLVVAVRSPPPIRPPFPAPGARVRFDIETDRLRPLDSDPPERFEFAQ